jgi:3-oxoacyl-[acyl-carrier protein] reductase
MRAREESIVKLDGAVAIVTGGGTGIGRATSLMLAAAGARMVVVNYAHSAAEAERTAAELRQVGCEGVAYQADVASDDQVSRMVEDSVARAGRLDVLVNNASMTHFINFKDLAALTDEVWQQTLQVGLLGTFYCCRAAAPHLRAARGAIVNIASISAHRGVGSSIAYAVTKAGVIELTRTLAVALAPEVRVNSVSPGSVETRWLRQRIPDEDALRAAWAASAQKTPLQVNGQPEQIAQAILGLLQGDFVTGQDLIVDGGRSLAF